MSDLLDDIAQRLQADYSMKVAGKHLRQGLCPECSQKSLWTFAASPWVVRCERLNNCGYEAHARELYSDLFESWSDRVHKVEEAKPAAQRSPTAVADAYLREGRGFDRNLRGKPRGSARGSSEQAGTACGATSVASGQLACEVQQGQPHQPLPTAILLGE